MEIGLFMDTANVWWVARSSAIIIIIVWVTNQVSDQVVVYLCHLPVINDKNCSLSIVLTAMDQKLQKS